MAMASVTRSTRRADGLRHPHQHMEHRLATSTRSHHSVNHHHAGTTRNKRFLGGPDRDFDAHQHKRQKITVEIPARLSLHSRHVQAAAAAAQSAVSRAPAVVTTVANPHPANGSNSAQSVPTSTSTPPTPASLPATLPTAVAAPAPAANATNQQSLTRHKEKVVNGLKHELDRLQPSKADTSTREPGRKLRSQEATRFKSELSAYFPDYDEVIGNDPKEEHLINLDTPILVLDPNPVPTHTTTSTKSSSGAATSHPPLDSYPIRGYGDALFTDLFDSQEIDFGFLEARYRGKSLQDPLPDSYFEPIHRKAERLEKSIRNSEKGRAQHERNQVVRLLDGLQGHDWLRVMGVSGITETKKKAFEPAREHFIKGCQAILDKFKAWTAEEKRRKLEKERAVAAKAEASKASKDENEESTGVDNRTRRGGSAKRANPSEERSSSSSSSSSGSRGSVARSTSDTPDLSDADMSAAKQLREEALAAVKSRSKKAASGLSTTAAPPPPAAPEPVKEFTSFFQKKYQRDAALSKSRRKGRTVLAWGHPIPEMPEAEFELPMEMLDEATLRSQARRKRRDKRGKGGQKKA